MSFKEALLGNLEFTFAIFGMVLLSIYAIMKLLGLIVGLTTNGSPLYEMKAKSKALYYWHNIEIIYGFLFVIYLWYIVLNY